MDGTGLKEESTPHDAPPLQLALREAAALMIPDDTHRLSKGLDSQAGIIDMCSPLKSVPAGSVSDDEGELSAPHWGKLDVMTDVRSSIFVNK
mmetsp:Transcript_18804/g.60090  ORF Transcript_18804/g.60090 Transcript_18804/m.60090 type:complete len:92 (-) Transcript_18804:32-307(-)